MSIVSWHGDGARVDDGVCVISTLGAGEGERGSAGGQEAGTREGEG